ncbi:hypothetical protein Ddye_005624 [Dipteronia dyeriana]|uniref:Myb/SANT-like domain-containing protein n=1 Tax=Dipteronia dyeriana TaxID=168575 RepID=A0AAD9XGT9_9ROSI|nr:hypothetical protein Ddye_005621 [Dipteronia dyeriana]KAK2659091.1 hypothetical protein Ddye_005624 [Dipteronia dyeriana]
MGKKNTSSITEIEGNGKQKAIWYDDLIAIFCEICVKEVTKGNWPGTHFDKTGWSSLLHKETGIGWDPAKKTVDAPPEWWQSKIEMNVIGDCQGRKTWDDLISRPIQVCP